MPDNKPTKENPVVELPNEEDCYVAALDRLPYEIRETLRHAEHGAEAKVAISGFHNGQPLAPDVKVVAMKDRGVYVSLGWHGSEEPARRVWVFDFWVAERWLTAHGVHLDGQGIYL